MESLSKILKSLNKQWKETEAAVIQERVPIPDGDYVAKMLPASVELSKSSNRLQIAWHMEIVNGKKKGKKITNYSGLDNEISISWIKATMNLLGIKIPLKATDIPKTLDKFFKKNDDIFVNITVKTSEDSFTNIYINGVLDKEDLEDLTNDNDIDDEDDTDINEDDDDDDDDDNDEDDDEDEDEDEDDKPETPSKKKVMKMKMKELKKVIKDFDLDVDTDDSTLSEIREEVVEELEDL